MTKTKTLTLVATAVLAAMGIETGAQAKPQTPVIEVVTLKIKPGVTTEQFEAVDHKVGAEYVAKRPGFLSRESAPGANQTWLAIVHWRSLADAEASMKSFEAAPAAKKFKSLIVADSMVMARYSR
jgi:hypothetical protein